MPEKTSTSWSELKARLADLSPHSARRYRQEAQLLELIVQHVRADTVALDLGANTGFLTLAVAQLASRGRVYALDLSSHMLGRLLRTADRMGLSDRVETIEAKASSCGLASHSVDLVISGYLLHAVPSPFSVVTEAARVIRTGGRIVVHDLRGGPLRGSLIKLTHSRGAHGPLTALQLRHVLLDTGFGEINLTTDQRTMTATAVRYRV